MFSVQRNNLIGLLGWCFVAVVLLVIYNITEHASLKGFFWAAAYPAFFYAFGIILTKNSTVCPPGFSTHLYNFFTWVSAGLMMQYLIFDLYNADQFVREYLRFAMFIAVASWLLALAFEIYRVQKFYKTQIKRNLPGCEGVILVMKNGATKVEFDLDIKEKIRRWQEVKKRKWMVSSAEPLSVGDRIEILAVDDRLKSITVSKIDSTTSKEKALVE